VWKVASAGDAENVTRRFSFSFLFVGPKYQAARFD
jgi:hypothetical protein